MQPYQQDTHTPGSIRVTIASKLSPNEIMRMIVRRDEASRKNPTGVAWASFVRGAQERLCMNVAQRIRIYDASNVEIRSVDDIEQGDHLIVVPMSEREQEMAVLQHPAPHPFHHRLYRDSMLIGGPHSVGITTFYNHREQHTDVPSGIKLAQGKSIPEWEREARMVPAEKRWMDKQEVDKMNQHAMDNLMKNGGSMGINTWFNRKEQLGDKTEGLKRFHGLGQSKVIGHPLAFTYAPKDVHQDHHIHRLTTDSRNRWKDFDPTRLPFAPPSPCKSMPQSRGSSASTHSSILRVPNLAFPQEFLAHEMDLNNSSLSQYTDSTGNSSLNSGHVGLAGTYTKVHNLLSKGKKQFYASTPNKMHRKLIEPANTRLSSGTRLREMLYNPMKTSVGSLLSSPLPRSSLAPRGRKT
jgi:hypothetical protein